MSCQKYEDYLIDYIDGVLPNALEQELLNHLNHCTACQQVLEQQREIFQLLDQEIKRIEIPHDFMVQVEEKLYEQRPKRVWKPFRWRIVAVAVVLCILLFSTDLTTGMMNGLQHWWQSVTSQQVASGDRIFGEEVNITAIDQDIRITITHVAADEFATVLYYEVEDLNQQGLYAFSPIIDEDTREYSFSPITIPNPESIWNSKKLGPEKSLIVFSEKQYSEEPHVLKGWMTMHAIEQENDVIPIQINSLDQVHFDNENELVSRKRLDQPQAVSGVWNLEIPIIKKETIEYKIDQAVEVDGVQVTIESLKVAPTTSLLEYSYQTRDPNLAISIERLEASGKSYWKNLKQSGNGAHYDLGNHMYYQIHRENYESLYYDDPKEVKIYFGTIYREIKTTDQELPINMDEPFPQTFEFLGSTISIDEVEIGTTTRIDIHVEEALKREFDSLNIVFMTNLGQIERSGRLFSNQYYVDRAGNRYDWGIYYRPDTRFTARTMDDHYQFYLQSGYENQQQVIPSALRIFSYDQTKFLDDTITIKLK